MNRKPFSIRNSVPIQELESYVHGWETRAPGFVKVYSIGESGGWPIMCAEFTDPAVPACEKEIALITAQHSGMEISGMNAVLSVGNSLASLDERARRILSTQTVLLVPCPNCYTFAKQDFSYTFRNAAGVDEYAGSFEPNTLELKAPEKTPAAVALKALVDQWKPELLIDAHGTGYNEVIMCETTGCMSFAGLNRTYHRKFVDEMDDAARAEGFPVLSEDELETLFPVAAICHEPQYHMRFRGGGDGMVLESYAYIQYHTLALNPEVAFERSGFLRIMKALEMGCNGYPVRRVFPSLGLSDPLLAGGKNAEERRASRVELWQQNARFGCGLFHPELPGMSGTLLFLNPQVQERICGKEFNCDMEIFLENMEREGFDMSEVRTALDGGYAQYVQRGVEGNGEKVLVQHSLTIGARLPYSGIKLDGVWLNGRRLSGNEYMLKEKGGQTVIRIMICPEDIPEVLFLLIKYDCEEKESGILG